MMIPEICNYIHGEPTRFSSSESWKNRNPATGEVLNIVHTASPSDVDRAVDSARTAFKTWSKTSGKERGRILLRAAEILRQSNDELAKLETLDTGKPISESSSVDILSAAEVLEYFAGIAPSLSGRHINLEANFAYTRREPLGVCAGIGAWNYPIQIAAWKAAPALACGNTMVFKPSELSPLSAVRLAEIFSSAGLPPGVFNLVQGDASVGKSLASHPDVAKISLTGSSEAGKSVMRAAADGLKKISLELGGKSPLIVFADAQLDNAVSAAIMANFYTQGEICSNGTRVFVEEGIRDQFVRALVGRVKKMKIGHPLDKATDVGAMISPEHADTVRKYIELGQREGAELIWGGSEIMGFLSGQGLDPKAFISPTIFRNCQDEMSIVRDEIFGPVMSLLSFSKEEEVIERANNTPYGLAAGVMTTNLSRAHRVVAELEAGTCWINNYNITPIEMPFGGYKASGFGRENGLEAIESYSQTKSVYVELGNVEAPY